MSPRPSGGQSSKPEAPPPIDPGGIDRATKERAATTSRLRFSPQSAFTCPFRRCGQAPSSHKSRGRATQRDAPPAQSPDMQKRHSRPAKLISARNYHAAPPSQRPTPGLSSASIRRQDGELLRWAWVRNRIQPSALRTGSTWQPVPNALSSACSNSWGVQP